MTKAVSGLGGTILLFVVISQFVDYFNYSNIPTLMAVKMADILKSANIGTLWLLLGFIVVVTILNLFFTPAIAKWAIFAPVFVPLFVQLAVDPAAVLAAYRVGDSPTNSHHAAERVLRPGRWVCPEVRQERGRWDGRRADVALRHLDSRSLDVVLRWMVSVGTSVGTVTEKTLGIRNSMFAQYTLTMEHRS